MYPESYHGPQPDLFADVRAHGDVIDLLEVKPPPATVLGMITASAVVALQTPFFTEANSSGVTSRGLIGLLAPAGICAGTMLYPVWQSGREQRIRAMSQLERQDRLAASYGEPVELFRGGSKDVRDLTLYWRAVPDGTEEDLSTRFIRLVRNITASPGGRSIDYVLLPTATLLDMAQGDESYADEYGEDMTLAQYFQLKKDRRVRDPIRDTEEHTLLSQNCAITLALELKERKAQTESELTFLLDTLDSVCTTTAEHELIQNFRNRPKLFRSQFVTHIRQLILPDLHEVARVRTDSASFERQSLAGTLNGGNSVLWISESGALNKITALTHGPLDDTARESIRQSALASPNEARSTLARYLYAHLLQKTVNPEDARPYNIRGITTDDDLSIQARLYDRYARRISYAAVTTGMYIGALPSPSWRERTAAAATALSLILLPLVAVEEAYRIGTGTFNQDHSNALKHPDASFGDMQRIGLSDAAKHGNAEAVVLNASETAGRGLYHAADITISGALNTFHIPNPSPNNNEYKPSPNLRQWSVTSHNMDASGYWITSGQHAVMPDPAAGWLDTSVWNDAVPGPVQPVSLMSREEAMQSPAYLQVSHAGSVPGGDTFYVPYQNGVVVSAMEVTDASSGKPVGFAIDRQANGAYTATIAAHHAPVNITYWLTPGFRSELQPTRPLQLSPQILAQAHEAQKELTDVFQAVDPAILTLTDPVKLADHIRTKFRYAINPLTTAQEANIGSNGSLNGATTLIRSLYVNKTLNCWDAANLFGLAAWTNGISEPLGLTTGYLNGRAGPGSDMALLTSHELHAYITRADGTVIDPTPNLFKSVSDESYFDESHTKQEKTLNSSNDPTRYTAPRLSGQQVGIGVGALACASIAVAGYRRRDRWSEYRYKVTAYQLRHADTRVLNTAHDAIGYSLYAPAESRDSSATIQFNSENHLKHVSFDIAAYLEGPRLDINLAQLKGRLKADGIKGVQLRTALRLVQARQLKQRIHDIAPAAD